MNELEAELRKAYEGIVDKMVKVTLSFYDNVYKGLPDSMSDEEKLTTVKQLIDNSVKGLNSSLDIIKPEDLLKGVNNG